MKIKHLILAALLMASFAMPAGAQFRFGPRVGMNISTMHFNKSSFDSDNRAGFTAGLLTQFTVPVIGVGFDASLMYVRRNAEWMEASGVAKGHQDYLDIPVNLRWNIGLPIIGRLVSPYLATGPAFSVLTGRKAMGNLVNKNFTTSWNVGAGVTFLSHLQIGASYGFGMGRAFSSKDSSMKIDGKNRYWTVTAAYLF